MQVCPLCLATQSEKFFDENDKGVIRREYWRCPECRLIFVPRAFHVTAEEECQRYSLHRNDPNDREYLKFLRRLADPLLQQLKAGDRGLDYGCGPCPAMQNIFNEQGFFVDNFDPYFFPDKEKLSNKYDFIVCSETAEHFAAPRMEFERFSVLLNETRGVLGIMTRFLDDEQKFSDWWYRRDPTHVAFYQPETFHWISRWQNWRMEIPRADVVIFQKQFNA